MAKPQRKSINDALAEIASQVSGPVARDHVEPDNAPRTTSPRDDVVRDHAQRGNVVLAPMERDHVERDHVPGYYPRGETDEDGYRVRIRREKPHVSLYAHPRVLAAIRDLAIAQRKKPHDLYVEGMRLMLTQYGLDFDELDGRNGSGVR
jgi:hypothetical protein